MGFSEKIEFLGKKVICRFHPWFHTTPDFSQWVVVVIDKVILPLITSDFKRDFALHSFCMSSHRSIMFNQLISNCCGFIERQGVRIVIQIIISFLDTKLTRLTILYKFKNNRFRLQNKMDQCQISLVFHFYFSFTSPFGIETQKKRKMKQKNLQMKSQDCLNILKGRNLCLILSVIQLGLKSVPVLPYSRN